MSRIAFIIFLQIIYYNSFAQGYSYVGARSNSLVNASIGLVDGWAYHHNPGVLGLIKKTEIGVSYSTKYLLKDFQNQGVVYAQPLKSGVLSFGAQLYGLDALKSERIGIGYSLKLVDRLSIGVQMNYQGLQLGSNYGSKNNITAEVGIYADISEKLKFGASVFNLGRTRLATFQDERITTLVRMGLAYHLSQKVLFLIETEKNIYYKLRLKGAFEYQPIKKFFLRGGIATQPIELAFGFGYRFKTIQLDLGSSYHQLIGWSPHISLTYKFEKEK